MPRRRLNERTQARAAQFAAVLSAVLHEQHLGHRQLASTLGLSHFTVDSWTRATDPALPGAENLAHLCSLLEQRQSGLGSRLAEAAQFSWTPVSSSADTAMALRMAPPELRTNLPAALTSFVGRESELAEVRYLLSTTRLLTLTGVGGVGKTRLALEVAQQQLSAYPHGVWLVELAALADPSLLWQVTAAVLGAEEQPGMAPNETLRLFLRDKHLLIVLDNCEHLVAACAQWADSLLKTCPQLQLLATTREALRIAGEVTYHVPPLALQPLHGDVGRAAAVQLFVARVAAVQPHFAPTAQHLQAIAQICVRLDGLPLALELAAARASVFSPEQIAARLDDRFRLLTGGSRAALPRQHTLRAVLDWSYDLLSEPEQALFRRLSVFAGGWDLEAAEVVIADGERPATSDADVRPSASQSAPVTGSLHHANVLELLSRLVDKSLVGVSDREGGTRFRFLETVRAYAHEKLLASNEAHSLRERHSAYFLNLSQTTEPKLYGFEQVFGFERLESELDNLRSALAWGLSRQPIVVLRAVSALWLVWQFRAHVDEGRRWLGAALSGSEMLTSPEALHARAEALRVLAELSLLRADSALADDASEQSVRLFGTLDAPRGLGVALCTRAFVLYSSNRLALARTAEEHSIRLLRQDSEPLQLSYALGVMAQILAASGDYPAAYRSLEECVRYSREAGAPFGLGLTLLTLGQFTALRGDLAGARRQIEESVAIFKGARIGHWIVLAGSALAEVARLQGEFTEAKALYRAALAGWHERGLLGALARCLECLAYIAHAEGKDAYAVHLLGSADSLRAAAQAPRAAHEEAEHMPILEQLRLSVGALAFQTALAEGRAMTLEQMVELARSGEPQESMH